MAETNEPATPIQEVDRNTVYTELYNEMRRYRDYLFTGSTWYTALLLAILAFVVSTRFSGETPPSRLTSMMIHSCGMKIFLGVVTGLIGFSSCYQIYYAYRRYRGLRSWVNSHLEPAWKNQTFVYDDIWLMPHHILYCTQGFIVVLIWFAIFVPI